MSKQTTITLSDEYTYVDVITDKTNQQKTIIKAPLTNENTKVMFDLWADGYQIEVVTKSDSRVIFKVNEVNISTVNFYPLQ